MPPANYESLYEKERALRLARIEHDLDEKATKEAVAQAKSAADAAAALVTVTNDKQFEHVEQLRATMVPRSDHEQLEARMALLEAWRSKAIGVGAVLVLFSGLIGAVIMHAVGG